MAATTNPVKVPRSLQVEEWVSLVDDALAVNAGGLQRIRLTGGVLQVEDNTAAAGDFSTFDASLLGGEVSGSAPAYILTETDQTLPAGKWRILAEGDRLKIEKNRSVDGSFTAKREPISLDLDGKQINCNIDSLRLAGETADTLHIEFAGSAVAANVSNASLYRDNTDNRLHYKDELGVDHILAYTV